MAITSRRPREIDGKGRTLRELLVVRKYFIDYYQHELKWKRNQAADLQTLADPASGKPRRRWYEKSQTFLQEDPRLLMWCNQVLTHNGEDA